MPFGLYLLGLAVFAQGTSEFMLSGLVPDIAREMGVSVPAAGSLTSAFAAGMVVGAPLMAVLARRWSRRAALLGFLGVFLVVHVVGAVTDSFAVLLVTRVVGALANAGFLAVAVVTAVAMVDADAKGRATSVLLGGVTVACVAGVPGGALLGQLWGWRAAFWAVVVLSVPALFAIVRSVPGGVPEAARASVRGEVRALRAAPAPSGPASRGVGERGHLLHLHLSRTAHHLRHPAGRGLGAPRARALRVRVVRRGRRRRADRRRPARPGPRRGRSGPARRVGPPRPDRREPGGGGRTRLRTGRVVVRRRVHVDLPGAVRGGRRARPWRAVSPRPRSTWAGRSGRGWAGSRSGRGWGIARRCG